MNPTSKPSGDLRPAPLVLALRVVGAVLLAGTAVIHIRLWAQGYDSISWIGPLFLLNAISGFALCLAVLGTPRRLLVWPAVAGALLELGTLGALILSSTVGLFGFVESSAASLFWPSVWVEAVGGVVLAALAVLVRPVRRAVAPEGWTEPVRSAG
jgi:hypothetical protein